MAITKLDINHLRNLQQVSIIPRDGFNFIFGPNGSGKTSLLEAIYCLGRAKSFRTHKLDVLIANDADHFSVVGSVKDRDRRSTLGIKRHDRTSHIRLNGQNVKRATQLSEILPIALIEPGLHRVVEEGPEHRRKFLDWGVFHVEPAYSSCWTTYRRLLQQRNAALRSGWAATALKHWDKQLSEEAVRIDTFRRDYLAVLQAYVEKAVTEFTGLEHVELVYQQGWKAGIPYEDYLQAHFESDRDRGFTQFGPHRADLRFRVANKEARDFLSRGQQKMFVASLILAQCLHLSENNSQAIILIDDLPAELDAEKRAALLGILSQTRAQIFITATEASLFEGDSLAAGTVFHVEHGVVREAV